MLINPCSLDKGIDFSRAGNGAMREQKTKDSLGKDPAIETASSRIWSAVSGKPLPKGIWD